MIDRNILFFLSFISGIGLIIYGYFLHQEGNKNAVDQGDFFFLKIIGKISVFRLFFIFAFFMIVAGDER